MIFAITFVLFSSLSVPSDLLPQRVKDDELVQTEEFVNQINSRHSTWRAGHNEKFESATLRQVKTYMGTILGGPKPEAIKIERYMDALPSTFDAREQWPHCPSILLVRDQSSCGSCWAFGSTESFNDRLCIAKNNTEILSPTDVLSCCSWTCGMGCNGGYPSMAWRYFKDTGVVSNSCFPYPLPKCAHHVKSNVYPPCPSDEYSTPKCDKNCADGTDFAQDKIKALSHYSISGVQDIMQEIVTKGPVTAAFTVYADFVTYKSGVYQHVKGEALGGHAVEIVGYGSEDGVDYWLVKNSWNESWGDKGYFKILRGQDECGIESSIVSGEA